MMKTVITLIIICIIYGLGMITGALLKKKSTDLTSEWEKEFGGFSVKEYSGLRIYDFLKKWSP